MQIVLMNVDSNAVHQTAGPPVRFEMTDRGQAAVRMTLTPVDKMHIHYPTDSGDEVDMTKPLAKGSYVVALVIVAIKTSSGGKTYDSKVKVNGRQVAKAKGVIADAANSDTDFTTFTLVVN